MEVRYMAKRRTNSELIAVVEGKIAYHEECIKKLQARKDALSQPLKTRARKTSMRQALIALKEVGSTPGEIMAMVKRRKNKAAKEGSSVSSS